MPTDPELLAAWLSGDRNAGNALFQRHFEAVRRFFVNKAAAGDVEDLVQQTFLACHEGKERFKGRSTFRTYLIGVAFNVLRGSYRRKAQRNKLFDPAKDSAADGGAGLSTLAVKHQEQRFLLDALRQIPLEHQTLLELFYWERMTGGQLAEIFEIPEDTVRSRLRRARELLGKAFEAQVRSGAGPSSSPNDLDDWAASIQKLLTSDDEE